MLHEMHGKILSFKFEYVHEIIFLCRNLSLYPYRVSLKLMKSKGLTFTNGISIFNYEFSYLMILKFLDITDMQIF